MHSYHLNFETLDNECCKFLLEKVLTESIKRKANIEVAFEKFSLLRIFQPRQAAHEN